MAVCCLLHCSANTTTEHCITQNAWRAHKCTGYHHGILVIESMDADSDTRRLSPVALLADSYIDLNNGENWIFFFWYIIRPG